MSDHSPSGSRPVIPGQINAWLGAVILAGLAFLVIAYVYVANRPQGGADTERRVAQKALRADAESKAQELLTTPARNPDGTVRIPIQDAMALIAADNKVLEKFAPPIVAVVAGAAPPVAFVKADDEVMKRGAAVYGRTCIACHQPTGKGLPPVFPSIAETPIVVGNPELPIKFITNGLMGPITVGGMTFNSMMPPVVGVTDQDISDVLTYVRQSFGNKGNPVSIEQVKAVRAANAARTAPWTTAELGLK